MPLYEQGQKHLVSFTLNGKKASGYAEPRMLLSDFLRQEVGVTDLHVGCEHGVCGCCTIRVDGKTARSCLMYALQIDGGSVDTAAGLAAEAGGLNTLQQAFKRHHALQCGYCTTGILMSTTAFLEENPAPAEHEVRAMLSGHICRCTGYTGMVKAIMETAGQV